MEPSWGCMSWFLFFSFFIWWLMPLLWEVYLFLLHFFHVCVWWHFEFDNHVCTVYWHNDGWVGFLCSLPTCGSGVDIVEPLHCVWLFIWWIFLPWLNKKQSSSWTFAFHDYIEGSDLFIWDHGVTESLSDIRIHYGVSMSVTCVCIRGIVEDTHAVSLIFMSKRCVSYACLLFSFRLTFKSVVSLSRHRQVRFA